MTQHSKQDVRVDARSADGDHAFTKMRPATSTVLAALAVYRSDITSDQVATAAASDKRDA
ncbi:hypothetical protein UC34_15360 [Pandoraea vervacti]|uniref:Uncharacterized protein n=1 Tax=Pandoraea vervacti TaxID=656178 RepID=A0ABN4FR49_9BURK|nr:hypothetical protein [Pandoraea vervacti]AJP57976.1 hypothetical protein UC34_15360 [Pandoraea vervacti]